VRAGGVIAIDNVLWGGRVADPAADDESTTVLRRVNEIVAGDPRADHVLLAIADGMTIARKR
jgi:predicted O-methyltransferase YrrM